MAEGQYKFSIGLDNEQLELDIQQAKKAFDSLVKQAKQAGLEVDESFRNPFDALGEGAPQVAQATRQFNGLNVATQQLVRELPAASMGLNTFFLAVSNNLPVLADQIKQVNEENKNLAAQGKPTTSVLKQIVGSLFSWQTALVLGVTALSMYGKEIGKWIVSLFKGKDALDAIAEAERELHQVRLQGALDAQEEVTKIRLTVQAAQDATASIEERTNAVRTLKEEYPDYFANLSNEQIMYGEIADSVQALVDKTIALAQARKSFNQLVENEQNLQLLQGMDSYAEFESANAAFEGVGRQRKFKQQVGGRASDYVWKYNDKEADAYEQAQDKLLKDLKNGGEEAAKLLELIEDKYDGDVDAFIKATQASNAKLEEGAQGVIADGANAAAEAAQRAAELRAKQIANTSARLVEDAREAATQSEVDAMAEGIQKKIAQINLDYNLEEEAITKRENELRELRGGMLTKREEEAIAAMRKANAAERDRSINAAYDAVFADAKEWLKEAEDDTAEFEADLTDTITKEQTKRLKAWESYYINYGTLKEKILGTTQRYNRLIAEAENEAERKSLIAERDAILAEFEVRASAWAQSLVDKTAEQLIAMTSELQTVLDSLEVDYQALDSSDSEEAKNLLAVINTLKAQIKVLGEQTKGAQEAVTDNNWDDAVQTFQEIAKAANGAANGIAELDEDLGNTLRSIAQLASTGLNLVVVIKKITDAAWTGAAAISAMEKASLILAAISAAIQVVSALFNLFRKSDEVEQTKRQFKELNDELERLHKLARIDNVEGTIFGANPFGNFINNLKAMQDALKDFEASKEAIRNKDVQYMDVVTGWNADGSAVTQRVPQGRQNLNDAISNMQVMTKHKTWFTGRQYEDLGNLYPELFDESGNVTLEGLQNLQNSDVWEKLGKKDRELIEQMIADWEDYNAAVEATKKYLSDVFGDLGGDLTDALLEAFKSGTDAAEAFGEATGKILERLAQDIVNMALIDPIMQEAEDKILDLQKKLKAGDITYEEYLRQTKEVVDEAANKAKDRADDASEIYEAAGVKQDSYSASASSKGFQTMSQETGSELNGRFTDIQGQTHRIAEAVEFNKGLQQQQTMYLQSVSETLAAIHVNTDSIEKHTRALTDIKGDISAMRRTMDNGGGM